MANIQVVKLVTGEELVVEITEETETAITFKNPLAAVLQRSQQNGGAALGFMPWMHSANGPFVVNRSNVICVAEVADEVKNGYNQIFGAGIVVPPKDLITG
jgi:hypothetical protein